MSGLKAMKSYEPQEVSRDAPVDDDSMDNVPELHVPIDLHRLEDTEALIERIVQSTPLSQYMN